MTTLRNTSRTSLRIFGGVISLLVAIASNTIYNGSGTPTTLPWNTYNYCNAPHVNPAHYSQPENAFDAKLVYLNMVMRHHKVRLHFLPPELSTETIAGQRTPDNLFPSEQSLNPPAGWDCHDFIQQIYARGAAQISRQTVIPSWHPYASRIWSGTCDAGQLTRQGLDDSIRHGKVSFYKREVFFHNVFEWETRFCLEKQ